MSQYPKSEDVPLPPEILVAHEFVTRMQERADARWGGAPLWHGWALREAFLAGVQWARQEQSSDE